MSTFENPWTTPRKLTQAIAREYMRRLGGKFRKDDYGDYRVKFDGAEYVCQDLDEAIAVARVMAGGHRDFEEAEQYLKDEGVAVDTTRMWRD